MRVLVCGGRDYQDEVRVAAVLSGIGGISQIIHGGERGADDLARVWAIRSGITDRQFNANWSANGKAAGPIRNQRMLDEGKPDLVVAFPGGRGTADMVRRARQSGVPVMEIG